MLKTNGGIAGVLRAIRGGELPNLSENQDGFVDEGIKESDYESPEIEIDLHAPDRAKRMVSTETIQHIIESNSRPYAPSGSGTARQPAT